MSLAQETYVRMEFTSMDYLRMPLIQRFGRWVCASGPADGSE